MNKFNPYESPQTPPGPKQRLPADALSMGKVLVVLLGLFVVSLCLGMAALIFTLWRVPWL